MAATKTQRQSALQMTVPRVLEQIAPRADSQRIIAAHRSALARLPQVRSGAVSPEHAERWLEAAARLHTSRGISQLLRQASGLGAQDMRALVAQERGEHYPGFGATEVIARKRLEAVPLPGPGRMSAERIFTNMAALMCQERMGITRAQDHERALQVPQADSPLPFLCARAPLIGRTRERSDRMVLCDLNLSIPGYRLVHDETTLNYLGLCAANRGLDVAPIMMHLEVSQAMYDSLVAWSAAGPEALDMLGGLARAAGHRPVEGLALDVRPTLLREDLMEELVATGDHYWSAVLNGTDLDLAPAPAPAPLDGERAVLLESQQKRVLAAYVTRRAADDLWSAEKERLEDIALGLDLEAARELPLNTPAIGHRQDLDVEGAAEWLMNLSPGSIPEERLYDMQLDTTRLAAAYRNRSDAPLESFQVRGRANRAKVEEVASLLGVSLEPFLAGRYVALSPTKTRGPEYDALQSFAEPYAKAVADTIDQAAGDPALNHPAINNNLSPRPAEEQPAPAPLRTVGPGM